MYITINDIIGEKTIYLFYPIHSSKEVPVITMLSDNVQYEILKPHTIIDSISPGDDKLILSKTYAGRELRSSRTPCGIKGARQKVIVTHNPSEIDQNQLLLVRFPDLGSDDVIIPGTVKLSFNIELSSTADPKGHW